MGTYKKGRPSRQQPSASPGEYRWRNRETGGVDYVGETSNLSRRKNQHERSDKPVSSDTHHYEWQHADGRSTSNTRREHERSKIEQHKPSFNQRSGGGGRNAR